MNTTEVATSLEKSPCSTLDNNSKRKKLSGDERLHKNRERNRMHARKTRERKKQQSTTLQTRIGELQDEGTRLRQVVDDRYTASVLLGLSQTFQDSAGENHNILSSSNICQNAYATALAENNWFGDNTIAGTPTAPKRIRRRGKYTPQERERIRRERNRMHAKRTRDRKKQLLELSESMIGNMESESHALREYLVSLKLLSVEEAEKSEERATESKKELAALKASQNEYDLDGDDDDDDDHFNDDNGDGDDEHDGSLSGSDDNEKGSWSGSNNGNDSINGDTSGDGAASTGSNNSSSHNVPSSSGSSRSHNSSGSGSGSGSDSPTLKHTTKMDWGKTEQTPTLFNYGSKFSTTYKTGAVTTGGMCPQAGIAYSPRTAGSKKSQSVESYSHGGVVAANEEANAEEKAAYLGYSKQQSMDKNSQLLTAAMTTQSSTAPSSSAQTSNPTLPNVISATIATADYYQGKTHHDQTQPFSSNAAQPTQAAAGLIYSSRNVAMKVPNILLSVIPQGILAPIEPGGVSPRGTFSPIEPMQGSVFPPQAHSTGSLLHLSSSSNTRTISDSSNPNSIVMNSFAEVNKGQPTPRDFGQYRNLPSSNIANGNLPL